MSAANGSEAPARDTHDSALKRIEAGIERLTEAGRQTDERIGKLVSSIGELIQAMKSQPRR